MAYELKKEPVDIDVGFEGDAATGTASSLSDKEKSNSSNYSGPKSILYKMHNLISLQKDSDLTLSEMFMYNEDLRPVFDIKDRPWNWYNYVFFWIGGAFNLNTFQIAGTTVSMGLSWYETWIAIWIGYILVSCVYYIAQRPGSHYHISFPVACRATFGTFGSIWPVINRVVMAIVWCSTITWLGGQCVQLVLKSIFGGDLDTRIHNGIPKSGTTTFQFLSFFIFWLIQLPFIYCKPQTIRHLFTVKTIICPAAGVAFLVWTIVKAGGIGPVVHQHTTLSSSKHGWAFVMGIMNCFNNFSTLIVNSSDFTRVAKTPKSSSWSQFIGIPIALSLTSLIGILAASASTPMYGETYWSPVDLMNRYVEEGTPGNRAGVFFIAASFALAQVGTNIASNTISAGCDMAALLPQYINIRRGAFLCVMIVLCICPWNFFTSSSNFTTYLSAYAVFLSSIAGVVSADYTIVRRGYLNVFHLYTNGGSYNYSYNKLGINWRAFAAYICGILPNVVGFAGAVGNDVPKGATYIYNVSYFAGYIVAYVSYCVLVYISPVEGMPVKNFLTEGGWYEDYLDIEVDDFSKAINEPHPNEYSKEGKKFL
ncbi:Uracil permease [Wickerhamomyces ciferrii]|uniref:Uracil permease n=1 Tax=Wickerhamomyces ciferrii (strain ATCC 14091 / BCRC 22168 / CBS 111 / JCM 3599 / NBRC 0793 / NRRL Y-1031 F-60-10) TaxID=1206466 RepID=K0KW42_WICCF|nr:Uracil permease [Wickerhamomyces ciferrii]CCH46197.1 Uracil permease [Wickerhamomyces ciferrii]